MINQLQYEHIVRFINQENWMDVLKETLKTFDCKTGTIHLLSKEDNMLKLKAQQGIPDHILPIVSSIPIGKGMAGIAAERKAPVQMCNLQTDASGIAKPSAKDTKVEGSLAIPILLNTELFGTFGIAKPVPYEFTEIEITDFMGIAELIAKKIAGKI